MKKLGAAQSTKEYSPAVKQPKAGRRRVPNAAADIARRHGYSTRTGDALVKACLQDLE